MKPDSANLLPISILHDFARRVESLGIPYMLTGSMAMFQYSVYRMTADVDIIIELQPRQSQLFIDKFEPDYVIPHNSMRRAIASQGMFNVIHQEMAFKVDCVIRKSTPFQQTAFERRRYVDFHGMDISVITAEDLIISKLLWAAESRSEKQLTDVRNLLRNDLDDSYIKVWTQKLNLRDSYDLCMKELGQ